MPGRLRYRDGKSLSSVVAASLTIHLATPRNTAEKLPRTVRVKTDGSVKALLACVDGMVRDWDFKQIVFAHGTNPYTEDAAEAFRYVHQHLDIRSIGVYVYSLDTGVKLFIGSKVPCVFCFEICTTEGRGGKGRECIFQNKAH